MYIPIVMRSLPLKESKSSNQDLSSGSGFTVSSKPFNPKLKKKSQVYHLEKHDDEYHHSKLGMHAYLLWKNHKVTDVTVKFKGESYDAHKPVLSCYSTHFKERILSSDSSQNIIVLDAPSITTDAFATLLQYMYTGHLELTCQNIGDVYTASRKLGIKTALALCLDTFVGKTNPEVQPVYLYATAKKLKETTTAERSLITMARHFEQIVGTKEFLDLNFEEVTEYLSCNSLAVRSEVVVYLAALKWLNVKFLDREMYIEEVINCVRFPTMTLNEILACHSPPLLPGIVEMPEVQHILLKATCYVAAKNVNEQKRFERYSCFPRTYLIPRIPLLLWDPNIFDPDRYAQYKKEMAATVIQAGFRGYVARRKVKKFKCSYETNYAASRHPQLATKDNMDFDYYSTKSNASSGLLTPDIESAQEDAPDLKTSPTSNVNAYAQKVATDVTSNLHPPVVSNTPSPVTSSDNEEQTHVKQMKMDLVTSEAESETDSGSSSKDLTPTKSVKKRISFFRGDTKSKSNDNVQDTSVTNMRKEGVAQRGMIIVLGGVNPRDPEDHMLGCSMLEYSPALDKWEEFGRMPVNRHHLSAILYHNAIYVIGGCELHSTTAVDMVPSNTSFKLQLDTMSWIQIADMNHCRMFHGSAVVQDKIYVAGGMNDQNKILDSIESYDDKTNKWDELAVSLSCPKMSIGMCAHKGRLWFAGGMVEDESHNLSLIKEVECYSPAENKMLHDVTELPGPRSYVTLVECDGHVYSIGGGAFLNTKDKKISSLAEVYFYDEDVNYWVSITPLPNPQHSVTAAVFGGAIYVLGGITTYFPEAISSEVVVYEPKNDIWARCGPMPIPREAVGAVAVPSDHSNRPSVF